MWCKTPEVPSGFKKNIPLVALVGAFEPAIKIKKPLYKPDLTVCVFEKPIFNRPGLTPAHRAYCCCSMKPNMSSPVYPPPLLFRIGIADIQ